MHLLRKHRFLKRLRMPRTPKGRKATAMALRCALGCAEKALAAIGPVSQPPE
jgi:hypothetical protein